MEVEFNTLELADALKAARQKKQWKQEDLASKVGYNLTSIRRIEQADENEPSGPFCEAIAAAFGLGAEYGREISLVWGKLAETSAIGSSRRDFGKLAARVTLATVLTHYTADAKPRGMSFGSGLRAIDTYSWSDITTIFDAGFRLAFEARRNSGVAARFHGESLHDRAIALISNDPTLRRFSYRVAGHGLLIASYGFAEQTHVPKEAFSDLDHGDYLAKKAEDPTLRRYLRWFRAQNLRKNKDLNGARAILEELRGEDLTPDIKLGVLSDFIKLALATQAYEELDKLLNEAEAVAAEFAVYQPPSFEDGGLGSLYLLRTTHIYYIDTKLRAQPVIRSTVQDMEALIHSVATADVMTALTLNVIMEYSVLEKQMGFKAPPLPWIDRALKAVSYARENTHDRQYLRGRAVVGKYVRASRDRLSFRRPCPSTQCNDEEQIFLWQDDQANYICLHCQMPLFPE